MAASSASSESRYRVRSISLPSSLLHLSTLRIEEELKTLKSWEPVSTLTSTASPLKAETICVGLSGLGELYHCVEDLLQLPLTQQAFIHHQHEIWVDEMLDGSLRLLDICSTTRDFLIQMKERVLDLQSSLRRRGAESSIKDTHAYICSQKKMKNEIAKCLTALKQMDERFGSSSLSHLDHNLSMVVRLLREVTSITISIFQSLSSFVSMPSSKPKPSKWSLFSKLMHKGQVACEGIEYRTNEVESANIALHGLCGQIRSKYEDGERVQIAQKRLKALEVSIEGLEDGLVRMFKHLVQTRVSLLNILTL